ncbi:hypothetical protein MHYP_G00201880 [Metynnis hypsauchen]
MKALPFFIFIFAGLGSAEVRVNQNTNKDQYTEGDSATFQCNITFDTEIVENCVLEWVIKNPVDSNQIIEMHKLLKYEGRCHINSNSTHSSMILESLTTNDTDLFLCAAMCTVDTEFKIIFGNQTKLKVKAQIQSHSWLHYLIFAINLLVFIVVTIICVIIVRKRKMRRNSIDQ